MAINKYDELLKLIAENKSLYKIPESLDEKLLEELIQEGLIVRNGNNDFRLTEYGKIIEVMGYKAHKKQSKKSPGKGGMRNWLRMSFCRWW